jgi:hypothetical protein
MMISDGVGVGAWECLHNSQELFEWIFGAKSNAKSAVFLALPCID